MNGALVRLPIRARLAIVAGVLVGLVLVALGTFVYTRLEASLLEAVDAGLRSRASILLDRVDEEGALAGGSLADSDEAFAQLLRRDGTILDATPELTVAVLGARDLAGLDDVMVVERTVVADEERIVARLLAAPAPGDQVLVVGAAIEPQKRAARELLTLLLIGGPIAVLLASAVGWIVAGAALRPVERLRVEAEAVSASEPGRRLPAPGTRDELARLADSLNGMLERLERAVERERRFLADASHELRTPLANLRAEIDLALRRARTPDELTASLRSASEESERLVRLAEDLLALARAEDGELRLRREPTDLGQLVTATLDSFAGRATSLGVDLRAQIDTAVTTPVDRIRMRQAIGNLVDNGLRHTPAGGAITVGIGQTEDGVEIAVEDTGPGFPDDFGARVGSGFSRPDLDRGRDNRGTGLGLAIVRAVVEAHGGSLRAETGAGGGARVVIGLSVEG
jgi:heavy metal sensor kinase